jgi:hypothetical protein
VTDLPLPEENLPAPPDMDVSSWDVMGAAWEAETIRTDAWNYTQDKRRGLATEMYGMLGSEAKMRIQNRRWDYENNWIDFEDMVLDEVSREVPTNPTKYGTLPLSREQFDLAIDGERKAELEEAQSILDQPGGGFAEFLGGSARAMTDQTSLMLLPFGVSSGALRTIVSEAALGAIGEAAVLPREFQVAEDLDLPTPDVLGRIGMGALLGGTFATGVVGILKGYGMLTARRRGVLDAKPADMDEIDAEVAVDTAEAQLRGDPTVQEVIAPPPNEVQSPAGPIKFDYTPAGNASPRTNRAGYVFGKFLELGYEPHIASGFVGNFMVESGPSLRTDAVGDGGAAYGIAQWNDRRRALEAFAQKRGKSPSDLDTQIAFVDHELKTSEAGAWSRISQAKDAREAAAFVSKYYERPGIPHLERRIGYAVSLQRQYEGGAVPKHDGVAISGDAAPYSPTTRGYTGEGQVTAGEDFRIDVEYEVLDISQLRAASGDFQPRDRSRQASDAWISDTAAQLDPMRLMPAPTADRGAPIVGPDGMIESGNGRVAAIARAYDQFPDRSGAYRSQIEAAGFAIPEGVERPVLVARRRSALSDDELRRFVVEAQDSGVAQMTPTEVARASSRAMTSPVLMRLDPTQPLTAASNGEFVKAALSGLPRSARNAMFGEGGVLNNLGQRQLREALFARAWPDSEILARFTETDAGPLKSLMEALDRAAPSWAALRADIEAGLVRPEMDVSPYVLDAMRLIGAARELSSREGLSIARAVSELLEEVDLLEGPVAPLTAALVRKFWREGKAAPADEVAGFLARYAEDARKAGATGGMFDGPGPADVLRAIDPKIFGDLPDDIGRPRGAAPELRADLVDEGYEEGAQSLEAEAADQEIAAEIRTPAAPAAAEILAEADPVTFVPRLAMAQPFDDLDTLYTLAADAQARLSEAGNRIGRELGITFKDPGLKERATTEEKLARKSYASPRQLTDVSRGGFIVTDLEEAEQLVAQLAEEFDLVDEGWARKPEGYVDRKLIVRHDDGMLSEVQIWTRGMFDAKKKGTASYTQRRALDRRDPRAIELYEGEVALYAAADRDVLSSVAFSADGMSSAPQLLSKKPRNASSDPSTLAVWATSRASTDTQSVPGSSMASATNAPEGSRNSTAGRYSQDTKLSNVMGNVPPSRGDTSNMEAAPGEVNTAELRQAFGDLEVELTDGTTRTAAELLDDLDQDAQFDAFVQACAIEATGVAA